MFITESSNDCMSGSFTDLITNFSVSDFEVSEKKEIPKETKGSTTLKSPKKRKFKHLNKPKFLKQKTTS